MRLIICCTAQSRGQAHDAYARCEAMYVHITRNTGWLILLFISGPPKRLTENCGHIPQKYLYGDINNTLVNQERKSCVYYRCFGSGPALLKVSMYSLGQQFSDCASGGQTAFQAIWWPWRLEPRRYTPRSFDSAHMRLAPSRAQTQGREIARWCSPTAARNSRKHLSETVHECSRIYISNKKKEIR